jgi:hypothetical protein
LNSLHIDGDDIDVLMWVIDLVVIIVDDDSNEQFNVDDQISFYHCKMQFWREWSTWLWSP